MDDPTKEELVRKLGSLTKDEVAAALATQVTKDELVSVLDSRLSKDELASAVEASESDLTRDQLGRRLAAKTKDDLVSTLASKLKKDELVALVGSRLKKDQLASVVGERDEPDRGGESRAPASRPAPAQPSLRGKRVRVDLSGLPMLGIFAGRGASAAGTITDLDVQARHVTVYLDGVFDGRKEIVVPPERLAAES